MELAPETDIRAARAGWQTTVADIAKEVAGEVISAAPPSAWTGREIDIGQGQNRQMNLPLAVSEFRRNLRRALPLAHLQPPITAPQEARV